MKILVVQESDWIQRGPHQSHHIMERLSKRGHEIRVIDFELLWRENKKKELFSKRKVIQNTHNLVDGGKVTVIRPPIIKIPILEYLSLLYTHRREINWQIEEFDPDVIIGWGILNSNLAIKLAKKHGIPFVYYIIDELFRLVPQKYFWSLARYIESQNLKKANKVLSINEQLREYTIQMGADRKNTDVIRAGVDLKRYNLSVKGRKIRNQYSLKETDIVLFFMGWLYNFSGLKEVATELSKRNDKKRSIKLLIVGEGDAYNDLQKIKSEYQLEDYIILPGWQPYEKIPGFIAAADICMLPADPNEKIMQNIVPIKMYEYMAMGKPVITTKLPGIMREFRNNNGVTYIDSPEAILNEAINLVETEKLLEYGSKARKFVEKNSWEKVVDNFEGVLKEVTR